MIELDNTMLLFISSESYSDKKFSYVNDLSTSLNCLIWRGGEMADTRDLKVSF